MKRVKPKWYRSEFVKILSMFALISAAQFAVSTAWNWGKNAERAKAFAECTESAIPDFACVLMSK